jgi:hypothetical protein
MEVREKEGNEARKIKRLTIGKRRERRRDFVETDGREVKGKERVDTKIRRLRGRGEEKEKRRSRKRWKREIRGKKRIKERKKEKY